VAAARQPAQAGGAAAVGDRNNAFGGC
jgi:hypothetical protein